MMTPLLETSGLQKSFGAIVAAKDISVVARRGEKLGLIGNNGAGKTTFVNLVTGYLRPDAGRILIDGEDIAGLEPRRVRRRGVSPAFQIPQLFASLTPEENLLIALGIASREGISSWRPARSTSLARTCRPSRALSSRRISRPLDHVAARRRAQAGRHCHGSDAPAKTLAA